MECHKSYNEKYWACVQNGLGLDLQGLYSTTNCADNIVRRFTIIIQIASQA